MHPTEIIELMVVGIIIVSILIIAFFLKGRWRKTGWLLALLIFASYCIFFLARPFWIDAQIEKKVQLLRPYLEERYPGEEWTISTVPHRKDGYKHLNPYYIGVVFESEPEVTYDYWVESKDNIYQISFLTNKRLEELEHVE
jgi:Ca2+/Na+ antiporter